MSSPITAYRKRRDDMSLQDFGDLFGVNKTTVRYWERKRVPPERVPEIERVTGISRHELRPDIFGEAA